VIGHPNKAVNYRLLFLSKQLDRFNMQHKPLLGAGIVLAIFTYLFAHYGLPLALPNLPVSASWIDLVIAVELGIPVVTGIYSGFFQSRSLNLL